MRKLYFLLPLSLTFLFSSCELSKDFMVNLEKEFVVNYAATSYSQAGDVDATKFSGDFDKYREDLKSLDIVKLSYVITSFTGSLTQKITNATLKVGDTDGSSLTDLASLSNVLLSAVAAKEQEIIVNEAGEDVLEDLLLGDDSTARLSFAGTANEAPVKFTIKFKIQCKVKYEKKLL